MRFAHLVVIASLFLAACGAPPTPNEDDWCFKYDLRQQLDINVQAGQWLNGVGLASVDGEIILNFVEDFYLHPSLIQVKILRPQDTPIEQSVSVAMAANIFAIQGQGSIEVLAANQTENVLAFENTNPPTVEGNSVSITLQGDVVVEYLQVFGEGVSPFGDNNCIEATATPTQEPATATTTPTVTATGTATRTPTPTGTVSDLCFRMFWDFTTSSRGFSGDVNSEWISGQGFVGRGFQNAAGSNVGLILDNIFTFTPRDYTELRWVYSATAGSNPEPNISTRVSYSAAANLSQLVPLEFGNDRVARWHYPQGFNVSGSRTAFGFTATVHQGEAETERSGSLIAHSLEVRGRGALPVGGDWDLASVAVSEPCWDQTPTPTTTAPTPTRTPTATRTPTRTPIAGLTITPNAPTRTAIALMTPTARPSSTPIVVSPQPTTVPPTATFIPPTATLGPTNTPYAPPTYTTATGFPVWTMVPPEFTPIYGGTGVPAIGGTPLATPDLADVTPIATFEGLPQSDNLDRYHEDAMNYMGTAVANVNALPSEITSQIPEFGGDFSTFASYSRWLTSSISLQEVMSPRFYGIGVHAFYAFVVVIFMASIRIVIWFVVLLIRVARWIIETIIKIIPGLG